jgi:ABC-type Na+ transport system ATPase subunit NatA
MGLCPQHDLLWETLTSREHLTFYGRLKGLEGKPLEQAVDKALKDVNLYEVGDKQAGQYSGGMKRRLSVAISLIGDPKVSTHALCQPESVLGIWRRHRGAIATQCQRSIADRVAWKLVALSDHQAWF